MFSQRVAVRSDQFARCSTNFSMSHLTLVNSGCCTTRRRSSSAVEMHSATRYVAGHRDMSFIIITVVVLQYSSKLDRGDYVVKLQVSEFYLAHTSLFGTWTP